MASNSRPRRLPTRLAVLALVTVVGLGAAGWKQQGEAYGALIDAYFEVIFGAGEDCEKMALELQAWEDTSRPEAETASQAFITAIGAIESRDDLAQVDKFIDDLWNRVVADGEKMASFGACLKANADVAARIEAFDTLLTRPVGGAIHDARVRIDEAEQRARPADMALAGLAGATFTRLVARYEDVVASYQGDGCEKLARAHDAWYANYFENFDQSSYTLMTEIGQMTPEQFEAFALELAAVEPARAAFDTAKACTAELEGDAAKFLERQSSTLSFLTEMVLASAPLNR